MSLPKVSIVVPTYNRPAALATCLAACRCLDYPSDLIEIVVIDDGSAPPAHPGNGVRILRQQQRGPASARNRGIAEATGEFIAFTDDDCEPTPTWLRELVAAYVREPDAIVGGITTNALKQDPFASASQFLVDYVYSYFERSGESLRFFTSNNFGAAASGLRRIGGFDETFPLPAAEDRDLCERWGKLRLVPSAVVRHSHHLNFPSFWTQHFRYGRGAFTLWGRRGERGVQRKVPRGDFFLGLVRAPFGDTRVGRPWQLLGLLLLSQVANTAGILYEANWAASRGRQSGSSRPDTPA